MKSSQIMKRYKDMGAERASLECILRINEEVQDMHKTMVEMAKMVDALGKVMTMQNIALDGMHDHIQKNTLDDEEGKSTRGLVS